MRIVLTTIADEAVAKKVLAHWNKLNKQLGWNHVGLMVVMTITSKNIMERFLLWQCCHNNVAGM